MYELPVCPKCKMHRCGGHWKDGSHDFIVKKERFIESGKESDEVNFKDSLYLFVREVCPSCEETGVVV